MEYNVIYGAEIYGELFCKELESNGIKIDYVIDQYINKTEILNKKIKRLNEVSLNNVNIFISITSPNAEIEVIKELKELNTKSILSFVETLFMYPHLIERCVKLTKTWYSNNIDDMIDDNKIKTLKELLSDNKSKKLLEKIIYFRKTLKPEYYPIPDLGPQYFPSDIDLFSSVDKIRFVDGGAFIGDTLSSSINAFKKLNKVIDYIASFEPDVDNIKKLSEEVLKQRKKYHETNFFIYPCGLWSKNEILSFNSNSNSNSSIINEVGNNVIQIMAVSLDQTLIGSSPNYVKMDIEGAEKEAILGMQEIIKNDSPILAISLYHKPKDIWELPLLINKLNNKYDMYFRIYGSMGLELVLYCVPKK